MVAHKVTLSDCGLELLSVMRKARKSEIAIDGELIQVNTQQKSFARRIRVEAGNANGTSEGNLLG